MPVLNQTLPQPGDRLFLTDGGLETCIIFHDGIDLPEFASIVLLENDEGIDALTKYYRRYLDIAVSSGAGFVLESATWRASRDWGPKLGFDLDTLETLNRKAVDILQDIRASYSESGIPIVVSGNIGPRGDGYVAGEKMTGEEATRYHAFQAEVFASANADVVTAMTMTYPDEAIGIVNAARDAGLDAVIGFTTETDGRLPDGTPLDSAIAKVDRATDGGPAYYMVNCAHTDHFSHALIDGEAWTTRIGGVRANASRLSHAELDEAEELDDGDPQEFGDLYRGLRDRFPGIAVFGGCCGTDHRHVAAASAAMA